MVNNFSGWTLLEQGGAQTATGTRARAQAAAAGAIAAATAAAAADQRPVDMRAHGGQGHAEEAVEHRGAQSQEDGA